MTTAKKKGELPVKGAAEEDKRDAEKEGHEEAAEFAREGQDASAQPPEDTIPEPEPPEDEDIEVIDDEDE